MKTEIYKNNLILPINKSTLNLCNTLDCGQCFRFEKTSENEIEGIAFSKYLKLYQDDEKIIFKDTTQKDFDDYWNNFFDLDFDYEPLKNLYRNDDTLNRAIDYADGIRILRQDPFEALISFIISQNNNIPRIKGSISKLSARFGKKIDENHFAFPTFDDLCGIKKSDLKDLGLGYRDSYIEDCINKIESGQINIKKISEMDTCTARETLLTIKGVGKKVAECVLLFGFHKIEAFPVDTWVKKVLKTFYPDGFLKEFESTKGIAQQYLFHYVRTCKDVVLKAD